MGDPLHSPNTGLHSRRAAIAGIVACGTILASSPTSAQTMQEKPSSSANRKRTSLHQEITLEASPKRLYGIFLDSKQFSAFSGFPATIDPSVGGAFSMFGGLIVGRNVELVDDRRIVQAWRPTHWDPGTYSLAEFTLKQRGSGTLLVLDHTGFPEGEYDHLFPGWGLRYWSPLKLYLAKTG